MSLVGGGSGNSIQMMGATAEEMSGSGRGIKEIPGSVGSASKLLSSDSNATPVMIQTTV